MTEHSKSTVLVVDDAAINIDTVKAVLGGDYTIKAATNAAIALKVLEKFPVDLILLDVMMPDTDGYDLCKTLKATPQLSNIPVLFLTAMDGGEDEAHGLALGAVDYITKPFNPAILKARVATHLVLANQKSLLEEQVRQRTRELEESRLEVIRCLAKAAEFRDNETGNHVIRVGEYSRVIGRAIGLSEEAVDLLAVAAPLHDLGKIGISDLILLKPGRLTEEEFESIKTHSRIGAEIIGDSTSPVLKAAKEIALSHHEKWDGSGYPQGLSGENIPLWGRIVAVCDVFDALSCIRPYKEPWPMDKIIRFMEDNAGQHFDPQIVAAFQAHIDDFIQIRNTYMDEAAD
jgi:putative two-component system response regulator